MKMHEQDVTTNSRVVLLDPYRQKKQMSMSTERFESDDDTPSDYQLGKLHGYEASAEDINRLMHVIESTFSWAKDYLSIAVCLLITSCAFLLTHDQQLGHAGRILISPSVTTAILGVTGMIVSLWKFLRDNETLKADANTARASQGR